MKSIITILLTLILVLSAVHADVVGQWNFNSVPPDANNSTGTLIPNVGYGTATLLVPLNATFSDGSTNDPASGTDDSGWNTTHYPTQSTSNLVGGVQFTCSTLGHSNIAVRWDQRVSSTASKYFRLRYSTDGVNFISYPAAITNYVGASGSTYYEGKTNDLSFFPGVNNNPNFAFRIVSEFENTATGFGLNVYATPYGTNTYSTAGTARFDLVTVTGDPIPGANTAPTISTVSNQTIRVSHDTGPLDLTVGDAEDSPASLSLYGYTSVPAIIPDGNISWGGSGANRSVTVAAGSTPGSSVITVWVVDSGGRSNATSFTAFVLPENTAPVISKIPTTNTVVDQTAPAISFTVGDLEAEAADLTLTAVSSNAALVADSDIVFGGAGSNRTVTVTPQAGQTGVAPIGVTVSDGTNTATTTFAVMVTPSTSVIFYEPFNYSDGSLLTNSGFLWSNRSGNDGEAQVTNGNLLVTTDLTEDVVGRLAGAIYNWSNSTVIYTSFKLKALSLPKAVPEYFAHLSSGSTLRARVFAGTTNADPQTYRLFVSNGSETNAPLTVNLQTNVSYRVVTRYDLDAVDTTLWVNPASESDPGATAPDVLAPSAISSVGFRQDSGLGASLLIDDLRVGLSFAAVMGTNSPPALSPIPLVLNRQGNQVVLTWTNAAFQLQAAPKILGVYTNVPGASSPYAVSPAGTARFFRLRGS